MTCPLCEKNLEKGEVRIRTSIWGFLYAGISHQALFWRRFPSDKHQKMLSPDRRKDAYKCQHCGTVIVLRLAPPPWEERLQ